MTAALFAILLALGGAYAVRQYLHQAPATVETPKPVLIPIAGADLMAGRTVTFNDIVVLPLTPEQLKQSKYATLTYMSSTQQIIGRRLRAPLAKGEIFQPENFYPDGMGPGLAQLLKPGQLAVSIPIHNVAAVDGFAGPGSVVDVLFRSAPTDEREELVFTLLERVSLLAIGRAAIPGQEVALKEGAATLALSPRQARALKMVEGRGELSLALRHPDDQLDAATGPSPPLALTQLFGAPASRRVRAMEIYRGSAREVLTFAGPFESRLPNSQISTPIPAETNSR
jgi:Flp pilus assembly protein CpaB